MTSPRDRAAVWAGAFYPADPDRLTAAVRNALGAAHRAAPGLGFAKAIVSPHAGYQYSGPIAGSAWAAVRSHEAQHRPAIQRVVVVGPSHRVAIDGIAVSGADTWSTPLGTLPVAHQLRDHLVRNGLVRVNDVAHAEEHTIEVQLPFLQLTIGTVPILPLVVDHSDPLTTATVLDEAWNGPGTLVVVSSDLSHYHDQATAVALDRQTTAALVSGDVLAVTPERACGSIALRGLLVIAREHGLASAALDVRTSCDTTGDDDRVVGYGAFAFTEPPAAPTATLGPELVRRARRAIRHAFVHQRRTTTDWDRTDRSLSRPAAVFVSLHINGQLRGCIGTLEPTEPLARAVEQAALGAAFEDPRFARLTATEYLECDVTVSVLSEPRPLRVGSWGEACDAVRHGDGVTLRTRLGTATLLPSVWEQFTTTEAFLDALWAKAAIPVRSWAPGHTLEVYSTEEVTA